MQLDTKYYIYHHINDNTGDIFYVGKGTGDRYKSKQGRSEFWNKYTKNIKWTATIVYDNLNESDAYSLEKNEIERIGRRVKNNGTLVNILPGGQGFPEHYISYRQELKKQLDLFGSDLLTHVIKELEPTLYKSLYIYKDNEFDTFLKESGYATNGTLTIAEWSNMSYDDKVDRIVFEYNNAIHNLKMNNSKLSKIKNVTSNTISQKHIDYMINTRKKYER